MLKILATLLLVARTVKPTEKMTQSEQFADPGRVPEGKRKRKRNNEFTSYYGRPVLKKAHWVWQIWFYFWIGGIAAGASAITAITKLVGDPKRDRPIIRAGHYISLVGLMVSPVLLILDLQRPERFLHMLRILKLRSPLSLGTYLLTTTGVLSGLNAARQLVEDGFLPEKSLPGKLALLLGNDVTSALQGIGGLGVGSYTGVLLSATATPLWIEGDITMGPLFISSAFSTGAASITLACALSNVNVEDLHRLDRIEQTANLSELAMLGLWAYRMKPQVRKFLTEGEYRNFMGATIGLAMVGPLAIQTFAPKQGPFTRQLHILTSLMVLTGGFLLRYTIVEAGKASTEDADAYHSITRGRARPTPAEQAAAGAKIGHVPPNDEFVKRAFDHINEEINHG